MEAELGSVSWGTMRSQDLVPRFMSCLEDLNADEAMAVAKEFSECWDSEGELVDPDSADTGLLVEVLFEVLGEYAPQYAYFGAHEGDGADYGFWISSDAIEEAERVGELATCSDEPEFILLGNDTLVRVVELERVW